MRFSQEKLAEILDVTYQQVQRYENGMSRLNVEKIQEVALALDVPVSYFFEGVPSPPLPSMLAEEASTYSTASAEENKLLKHFRRIEVDNSKKVVIQVARLAVRAESCQNQKA